MSSLRLVPVSGQPIEVEKEPSMVGRDPGCEIVVTDGSVSRRHARLERRGVTWWVVDQGSANGTYLNSQRIAEQALKAGQELRFGALAFRVEIAEDPEATVATPLLEERGAPTLLASTPAEIEPPRPAAPPVAPPPAPKPAPPPVPPPIPPAAAAPPTRPAAPPPPPPPAAARVGAAPAAPVGQMAGGPPPAKKGRSPIFWVLTGCCGCILLVGLLVGVIAGGAFMATRPAATAAQTWLAEVRQNQVEAAKDGLSSEYQARLDDAQFLAIATVVQGSKDATFMSRSIENDRATLRGVLTGGAPQPITIVLVKEGGEWKVDDVRLGVE
jgi:predicted component of type VI protein secretion system